MSATQDIGRMMQDYAEDAVRMARQLHVELDYSEQSLEQVEHLLAQLHNGLQIPAEFLSGPQVDHMAAGPVTSGVENRVDELARVWGGYLGEVVRRRFGGEWTVEKYPAGDFLIVTLNVNGAKLFPAMKIHKRLTNGAADDLLAFYRNVRARLEVLPGGKVQ
ncbi:MAG: hypothetical protein DMG67_00005 [Acidobacteria bacterium]|nr:MAG: hypothetical protein DMG67_00005 [Acidobacteriota bacterium]